MQPPAFQASSFNCPHCGALAQMVWHQLLRSTSSQQIVEPIWFSICLACARRAIWYRPTGMQVPNAAFMVYPPEHEGPLPSPDMPEGARRDYEEARAVLPLSARSAAALLRLAIRRV